MKKLTSIIGQAVVCLTLGMAFALASAEFVGYDYAPIVAFFAGAISGGLVTNMFEDEEENGELSKDEELRKAA